MSDGGRELSGTRTDGTGGLEDEGKKISAFTSRELSQCTSFRAFSKLGGTERFLSSIDVGGAEGWMTEMSLSPR